MANDQRQASTSRRIIFRSKGGVYSAIFMSDKGDLFQEYDGTASAPTAFYPDFTVDPATLYLTITSSTKTVTITPLSVEYSISGVALTFDASGACTTAGFGNIFRKDGDGNLVVIGNLVGIASGAGFDIQAKAYITTDEFMVATHHVSVSAHIAGTVAKLTITPGDNKNFTITESGGSCILKARLFKDGKWSEPTTGIWEQLVNDTWVQVGTGKTLTVNETDVNTYANFRLTLTLDGETYTDTQNVLDASDPLDILISTKVAKTAAATAVTTNDLSLDTDMPDGAYLLLTPTMVVRGQTTPVGGTVTWKTGVLVNGSGLQLRNVPVSAGAYKITVADIKSCGGVGEYDFIISGEVGN